MSEVIKVPVTSIRENPVALRAVNKENEQYIGLVNSIRNKGFNGAIMVREGIDSETQEKYFELIDGLHRWNAAKDAGLEEISVQVKNISKYDCMEEQVMMNLHKVDTRPVEFTHQLNRMIGMNPNLTSAELAARLGKHPTWISGRLSLLKLADEIQNLVDDGKITLSNAMPLCKLPKDEQVTFIQDAMSLAPAMFTPKVNARLKEIREARAKGATAGAQAFVTVLHFQKKADVESEMANPSKILKIIEEAGVTSPADVATLVLKWVMNNDPQSIAKQQAMWQERKDQADAAAAKRKADREAKKAAEAAEKLAVAGQTQAVIAGA